MRTNLVLATVAFSAAILGRPASADELHLRIREKRIISVRKAKGLTLDNPSIADARILNATQIELVGKENGEGKLLVLTADGNTQTFQLQVTGAKTEAKGTDERAGDDGWRAPRFGGQKIANARCNQPFAQDSASTAFEDARALLKKNQLKDAIVKLDEVLKIEPDGALAHLFLGAAWAKLKDQAQGAYHYETFALSCPDDPNVDGVVTLLREFERRLAKKGDAKRSP